MNSWVWFLFLACSCVVIEGFFSMFEMACVSLNKVKLQYAVNKNRKKAIWINSLINRPAYLFGTTLVVVNTVLQIGSESARRFYESVGLSPDFAPITQVIIVLIFGELVPLFAARRYPEHVTRLTIPIVYLISKLLTPIIFLIQIITNVINYLFQKKEYSQFYLSREEIQKAIEEQEDYKEKSIDQVISNIFSLKTKLAKHVMISIDMIKLIPSQATLSETKKILGENYSLFIPIYHHLTYNIVAIAYPKDILDVDPNNRIIEHSKSPWFVTENTSIMQIIHQFRSNNQSVAVILDKNGKAVGFVTLDEVIDEVLGEVSEKVIEKKSTQVVIEKTLSGDMTIKEFNKKYNASLEFDGEQNLSDLISSILDHHPSMGEVVIIDKYEFTIEDTSLLGAKTISVKTIV